MKTKFIISAVIASMVHGSVAAAILPDYIECEIHRPHTAPSGYDYAVTVKNSAQYGGDIIFSPNNHAFAQKYVIHHQYSTNSDNYYLITAQSNISRQCIIVQQSAAGQQLTQGSCTDPAVQRIWKISGITSYFNGSALPLTDEYTITSGHVAYLNWDVSNTNGIKVSLAHENNNKNNGNFPTPHQIFYITNCRNADNPSAGVISLPR